MVTSSFGEQSYECCKALHQSIQVIVFFTVQFPILVLKYLLTYKSLFGLPCCTSDPIRLHKHFDAAPGQVELE